MRARLVVTLCLLLAVSSLWIAAAPVAARLFGQGEVAVGGANPLMEAAEPVGVDLGPVLAAAPFGLAEDAPEAATPDGTQSDLTLLGTTIAQPEDASRAIIAGGDIPIANYTIGSTIATGAVLTGVFSDHVVLDIDGQSQELRFPPGSDDLWTVSSPVPDDAEATEAAPNGDTLLGHYRAELLQDAPGLMDRLGLDVTDQGYLVTAAVSDEILRAGLQPDDLIREVNGRPLGDLSLDPAVLDEVAALGHASLAVRRGDKTILMTFPLK